MSTSNKATKSWPILNEARRKIPILDEATRNELKVFYDEFTKHHEEVLKIGEDENNIDKIMIYERHLVSFQRKLDQLKETITEENNEIILLAMKSSLFYEAAKCRLQIKDFLGAKRCSEAALRLIFEYIENPLVLYLYMRIINYLSYALVALGEFTAAKNHLEGVTTIRKKNLVVYTTEDLFCWKFRSSQNLKIEFQSVLVHNLDILSWVYSKIGKEDKSNCLQLKILFLELSYGDFDLVEWAGRCTKVACRFIVKSKYKHARYYLSAAECILSRVEPENIVHSRMGIVKAEFARTWVFYGKHILERSKLLYIRQLNAYLFSETVHNDQIEEFHLNSMFRHLDVIVANVPAQTFTNVTSAQLVFDHSMMWARKAQIFYDIRDYPKEYSECFIDLSDLYRLLAFYEPDLNLIYIMQMNASTILENLWLTLSYYSKQYFDTIRNDLREILNELKAELIETKLHCVVQINDCGDPKKIISKIQKLAKIRDTMEEFQAILNVKMPVEKIVLE